MTIWRLFDVGNKFAQDYANKNVKRNLSLLG